MHDLCLCCLTHYDEFGASFSWIASIVFSTPVNTGVRGIHGVDNEVENASFWSAELDTLTVRVVDAVLPVHDANIVVVVWRRVAPINAVVQHGLTLKRDRMTLCSILLFACDT